ncbi:LysR family transcriptional regulator [Weissella cibaria]|uniref:LysR family transcriptional regulator n=1 Tax=Weissella cibaria TaxID=137591 RepID=UPI000D0B539D|nr:LysR family transcriptional regulator [Weissella cibaria]AVO67230.1 LysR family transcriptional regulator [Weissella cibaria]MCT0957029.1 LysR family transcriptional regulator [Weissella cibaria]NKN30135.1 LysR family transcriptional regulator [Weissella cibaria]NKN79028.1 LysR family transcriptional regulator [Weissella cibaria]NKN96954.1 LysR family transcriptional regulator [Weissella cibaria]
MLLNDLDYFVTLAEEGTFTKASQKKYVSQPSITNALQRLEKELGETLIIRQRGTRSVVLTEAGQILYKHSKQILRETEIIKSDISNQQKIWLGVPPIIGATIFSAIMRRLGTDEIDAIHMVESGSSDMYELLDKDRVDMGFVGSLTPERSKQYDSTYITKSSYVVALPVDHPLATRDYLSFEDLRGERFISVGDAFTQHQVLVDQLRRYDMHDEIDNMYITNELMTEQGLIAAGNGVGIMIKLAVAGRRDIAMVPLRDPIDFYIYLIQKRDHQLSDFENITKQKMVEAINDLNF